MKTEIIQWWNSSNLPWQDRLAEMYLMAKTDEAIKQVQEFEEAMTPYFKIEASEIKYL